MLFMMTRIQDMKRECLEMTDVKLSAKEVARIRKFLMGIDQEATGKGRRSVINTRTRNIRLVLSKAERREKNTLL